MSGTTSTTQQLRRDVGESLLVAPQAVEDSEIFVLGYPAEQLVPLHLGVQKSSLPFS